MILSIGPYFNHSGQVGPAGPGEQADVVDAVEWAASQPWSTGKVGMYGKSYDGVTGLIGVNHAPSGLEAVVSQEPVYDLYCASGEKTLDLWSADWKIAAGHRIAVRVTDANEDWWIHTPLFDTVKVVGGSVSLPFLTYQRTDTIEGQPGTQLAEYLDETITVPPETMRDSVSSSFQLPPPQQPRP